MLIAEYRGLRHDDADALRLARRWSKVVAVLFAVGAVTGTVLRFEMGLLWPGLMDVRRASGSPSRSRGSSSSSRRSSSPSTSTAGTGSAGWAHFWSAVPIVISGVGGAFSVIAVERLDEPAGRLHLDADGHVPDVKPFEVIFNTAICYEFVHMLLAAYIVTGLLVASVYAVGDAARPPRPLPPARLADPVHGRGDRGADAARRRRHRRPRRGRRPAGQVRGDGVRLQDRRRSAEHVRRHLHRRQGEGRHRASPASTRCSSASAPAPMVTGLDQIPANERPPRQHDAPPRLRRDGRLGTAPVPARGLVRDRLVRAGATCRRRRGSCARSRSHRRRRGARAASPAGSSPRSAASRGSSSGYMRTADAVTPAKGIWWVFALTMLLYIGLRSRPRS